MIFVVPLQCQDFYPYSIQTQIVDKTILSQSSEILSKAYPGMFVAPFDMLKA